MKKLMIAAAIVCAAAMSQAAAIDWAFSETAAANASAPVYKGPADISGMTLYVFNATTWAAAAVQGSYESTVLDQAWDHVVLGDKVVSKEGTVQETWTWDASNTKVTSGDITKDQSYNLVFVVSDGEKFQALDGAVAAVGYDPEAPGSITAGALNIKANGTPFTTAGMTAFSDVPEPTSAMLLLLGVAGLALKRKRA